MISTIFWIVLNGRGVCHYHKWVVDGFGIFCLRMLYGFWVRVELSLPSIEEGFLKYWIGLLVIWIGPCLLLNAQFKMFTY